jgi:stage II sporulation protein R
MKNKIISSYFILLSIATLLSLYIPKNEVTAKEEIIIPNEAIRLRILANSDSEADQALKRKVRDAVNAEITKWVQDLTSLEEARKTIQSGLPEIQQIAEQIVQAENSNQAVKAEFDKVEFPTKLYGQFLYPAGEYEAILITIGEGAGANWWCVLFPPLCFLDFSNGVAVSDGFAEDENQDNNAKSGNKNKEENADDETEAERNDHPSPDAKKTTVAQDKTARSEVAAAKESNQSKNSAPTYVVKKDQSEQETTNEANSKKPSENKGIVTNQSSKKTAAKDHSKKSSSNKAESKPSSATKTAKAPVYTGTDEQEVEVKFFVQELWQKIF